LTPTLGLRLDVQQKAHGKTFIFKKITEQKMASTSTSGDSEMKLLAFFLAFILASVFADVNSIKISKQNQDTVPNFKLTRAK
jgi:hypothetical protein